MKKFFQKILKALLESLGRKKERMPSVVPVTGITLDKTVVTISEFHNVQLNATIQPSNATNKEIDWTSSSIRIAPVTYYGNVTGIAPGTVTIKARTMDGDFEATCQVTVTAAAAAEEQVIPVKSVTLDKTNLVMNIGHSETLTATVLPENATNKVVHWKASPTNVLIVGAGGKVIPRTYGVGQVFAISEDNDQIMAVCDVKILKPEPVTGVVVEYYVEIKVGETRKLGYRVSPENATNKAVTWESTNPRMITVDSEGNATAHITGSCDVIVKTVDGGFTATCMISAMENKP